MKEELLRVLNNKLDDINSDIDSLVEINSKIDAESENLSYVSRILDLFKDDEESNILNFSKLEKEDYEKVINILGEEAQDVFNTESCNYDGLVYLINGINNGISLELNDEQKNGINYLINGLNDKVNEYSSAIDGYELVKNRYEISNVDELKNKKSDYELEINNLQNEDYIKNTDLVMEAINFSGLSSDETIEILTYILGYNATVYDEKGPAQEVIKEDNSEITNEIEEQPSYEEEPVSEPIEEDEYGNKDNESVFTLEDNKYSEEQSEENINQIPELSQEDSFHFNDVTSNSLNDFDTVTFDLPTDETSDKDDIENTYVPFTEEESESHDEIIPEEHDEIIPEEHDEIIPEEYDNLPIEDENNEENSLENLKYEELSQDEDDDKIDNALIDNDFKDVISSNEDYDRASHEEDSTSTPKLQEIFDKYGVKLDNAYLNELVAGNMDNYQEILEVLKKRDLLDRFSSNNEAFVEVLLNSNADDIIKVLEIIEDDLSVDKDDFVITTKIAIDTIPSIFIRDGGNYHNFIENTRIFKELGINLINLFDFSKEIFVADHDAILKNLEIVKKYGYEINYKNAKYLLLLSDIADRMDYYIESVYEDKLKNETFDGAEYIKDYTAKLNVVTDETIKRIRYASENGRKVFGTKPKSLTGEITNLKVNALDISSDYLNQFFNNSFANLTGDEVREYIKLIHNSSNVGDYSDELEVLNQYLNDLRYVIEGINISHNKVVRNYNILRSYGMDKKKSLEFAVCYNLVITKEEYDKLGSKLDEIGGNL